MLRPNDDRPHFRFTLADLGIGGLKRPDHERGIEIEHESIDKLTGQWVIRFVIPEGMR